MAEIADKLCKQLIPDGWQTLIFIKNEKQADLYLKYIGEAGTIAMAKKLTAKQRKEIMERMRGDDIKRCIASDIYSQGVTFNHVRVMINMSGGGNNTTTIQKPGRLAEVREGKKAGVIIDFAFYPADGLNMQNCGEGLRMMFVDSNSRRKAYTDKGYEVIDVSSFDELAALTADVLV
jgi:superfamily II DNA/RNA helicase